MLAGGLEDLVATLLAEDVSDAEKLTRIRRYLAHGGNAASLQAAWPAARCPVVGPYFCMKSLGQGTSGAVFQALRLDPEPSFVALKILRLAAEAHRSRFFAREIEILRGLVRPNVVRHLDSGTAGGAHYLAMELVPGRPLDEYLAEKTRTLDGKLAVFEKVCAAVAGMHEAGVIHRDLKPRHIIVNEEGEPTIVDFGLSAVRSTDWPTEIRQTHTELGQIMGTIKYMSPEQAWGGLYKTDHRTDIWSLGIMLYETVTDGGYPYDLGPLEGVTAADALLYRIQTEAPRRPVIPNNELAGPLTTLISRCLVHEPDRRLPSAAQLAADLARLRQQRAIVTRPLPLLYRTRRLGLGLALHARFALWAAAIFGVVFVLSIGAWLRFARWEAADDYSSETRKRLIMAAHPKASLDFLILGIGDRTVQAVPDYAASNGIADVSSAIPTWRAVHGRLMERLAEARARLVVWDVFFLRPRPQDDAFVRGAKALTQAGTGLALATRGYTESGDPQLSPGVLEPLRREAHYGLILGRDMVMRPGEIVLAIRRGEQMLPSLPLAAFAALTYPRCRVDIEWPRRHNRLLVRYRQHAAPHLMEGVDELGLSGSHAREASELGVLPGDVLACKSFPLTPPEYWESRTIAFEDALTMPAERLRELAAGRIILVADVRTGFGADRHPVQYADGVVEDVPGGYVIADAIKHLIEGCWEQPAFPNTALFAIIAGMSVIGCFAGVPLGRRIWRRYARRQMVVAAVLGACGLVGAYLLVTFRQESAVQAAAAGAALCLAAALSMLIEGTRQRHLLPTRPIGG